MRQRILSLGIASVVALLVAASIAQGQGQQGQIGDGPSDGPRVLLQSRYAFLHPTAQTSTSTEQLERLLREGEAVVLRLRRSSFLVWSGAPVGTATGVAATHLRRRAHHLWRLLEIEARKLAWRGSGRGPSNREQLQLLHRVQGLRSRLDDARHQAAAGDWQASLRERRRNEPGREHHRLRRGAALESPRAKSKALRPSRGRGALETLDPPSNDDCASATPIGNGTFSGDTSEATNDGSASCGVSGATPDVWFRYTAPAAGMVSFDTFGSSFDTVLSLHSSCPGTTINQLTCNDDTTGLQSQVTRDVTAGEELLVRVSGFAGSTGSFVLHVGLPGSISGVVTEDGTGAPLAGIAVEIFDARGSFVGVDFTASDGSYSVGGRAPGSYFATTRSSGSPHIDELFDDIPCPGGGFFGCEPTTGTPITVSPSGDTAGIDFALTLGGTISGTVTEDGTGTPLGGVEVEILGATGFFTSSGFTAGDGTYTVSGLASGSYFAVTSGAAPHIDELFDDIPCPGGSLSGCGPTTGTPIAVTAPGETTGVDFALAPGGTISGTVTEDGTGIPLAGVEVQVFDVRGSLAASVVTAPNGTYSVDGLASGSYLAATVGTALHIDELFDDVPCNSGLFSIDCDPVIGERIPVTAPGETTEINFALTLGGTISGTVTEDGTSIPLAGVEVQIFDASGARLSFGFGFVVTAPDGTYSVAGLSPGTYFASTRNLGSTYIDELFDDISCPGGGPFGCEPTTGTPITVTAPGDTAGIDFALTLGGSISGRVTDDGTGIPLEHVNVEIFDADGSFVNSAHTEADGTYSVGGLLAGDYYASTRSFASPHVDELFDDLPCPFGGFSGCEPTDGTPIVVTAPGKTLGVDFALTLGGTISGTVTEEGTGNRLGGVSVRVSNADGHETSSSTFGNGTYAVSGLPSGSYLVRTSGATPYLDELFDDRPCPFGVCEVTSGTPVAVVAPGATSGVDFALTLGGSIRGMVVEDGSGVPLALVGVEVFDANGRTVGFGESALNGLYAVTGLPSGSYFAATFFAAPYVDKLFDDLPCPGGASAGGCDPTTGTPIAVLAPGETTSVTFALPLGGRFSGRVTDGVSGSPIPHVSVEAWDAEGRLLSFGVTAGNGTYAVTGLASGNFFARTFNSHPRIDERYDDVSCVGTCDPTLGTAIPVIVSSDTPDVDFVLYRPGENPELVLQKEEVSFDYDFCATHTITVGPDFGVQGTADVSFTAALFVAFLSDFSASSDVSIEVGTDPWITCQ